jgi:hypothetical protein
MRVLLFIQRIAKQSMMPRHILLPIPYFDFHDVER